MSTRRIDLITRVQYALVTRAQALAAGLSDRKIRSLLRKGIWIEIRPSVYAIAGAPRSWHQMVLASVLAHGADSHASHATTAHLFGLKSFDQPELLELVSGLGSRVRLEGVRARRSGALFDSDLTVRHRIPTVTAERALIDVSSRLTADRLGRVLDDAIRRRLIHLEEFRRCAGRLLPAPGRSMSKVHAVLAARIPGYDPGDSDLET
ncbi:MAG TPA: type IV toxin-antitoxin system AbiEi family antitoxin domain-containing protein, partial [Acidimicrobiales bacterium]|nr:type IV toxin-antitoxin system AbiEi family antitoxin domain-containing protein [Acidimicrobiales bacterium]